MGDESSEKLARFDKVVAGETPPPAPFPGAPGGPVAPLPDAAGARTPSGESGDVLKPNRPGNPPPFAGMRGGFPPTVPPIKPFVIARAKSVADQLAGKLQGQSAGEFGPPRPPGGRGAGPGDFLARPFMNALDADKDGELTNEECVTRFAQWFESWDAEKSGTIGEEQLRSGIERDLFRFPVGG